MYCIRCYRKFDKYKRRLLKRGRVIRLRLDKCRPRRVSRYIECKHLYMDVYAVSKLRLLKCKLKL